VLSIRKLVFTAAVCILAAMAAAQTPRVEVLTRNYDNQRTGANTRETVLNASNVNAHQFGKLFQLPVDDQIYAGLLYAANVPVGARRHNVLYAATVNNSVYAYDADQPGPPLWFRNFNGDGRPTRNTEVGHACGNYQDFIGNIGIVGTPVISPTRTMYFVTRTVEGGNTFERLHAIDIATGRERPGSPKLIQARVPGAGEDSIRGVVTFNAVTHNQRSALAYQDGTVYIAFASFCDTRPYHGWMMAYDTTTLAQTGVFNSTPNNRESGIWMSGAGPGFDRDGNLYVTTGNGTFDGQTEFGETLLKLQKRTLHPLDFFAVSNYNTLNEFDLDFGTQGPTMLPGTNLLAVGGKEGKVYVVDTTAMGRTFGGDLQLPQVLQAVDLSVRPMQGHHMHNSIPAWKGPDGLNIYTWGESDFLRAYRFDPATRKFNHTPFATGDILPTMGMPSGMMTLSADGSKAGTGIVWATMPRIGDANQALVPGNLSAFNAETLKLLWTSNGPGDDIFSFAKGSPPVVANGKVYAASVSRFVSVFGLRSGSTNVENLALNKPAIGSAPCEPDQTADKAVDGDSQGGPMHKWCSAAAHPFLEIDLGKPMEVGRFVVEHAGAGSDDLQMNTREFNIQVSNDKLWYDTVVDVWTNIQAITTHDVTPVTARYVRLNIQVPNQVGSDRANIYEFQVFPPITPRTPAPFKPAPMPASLAQAVPTRPSLPAAPADVAAPPADAEGTVQHVAMKVLRAGTGDERPGTGDCVRVRFSMWERDGTLVASSLGDSEIMCVREAIVGVADALRSMVAGEKRRVWIPADTTWRLGQRHHMAARPEDAEAPPHRDLTCDLELVSVLKAPLAPKYLLEPSPRALQTASGLAYEILKPGTGTVHPTPTSTVRIHFNGWTTEGTLFESTTMNNHPALVSLSNVMPGWREGISYLTPGAKARFWIPANLAFGMDPLDRYNPRGPLVYEIELIDIQ